MYCRLPILSGGHRERPILCQGEIWCSVVIPGEPLRSDRTVDVLQIRCQLPNNIGLLFVKTVSI